MGLRRLPQEQRQRLVRSVRRARWGNLRRLQPISDRFGFDRGLPIDRHYMERFLAGEVDALRGVVGEVSEPQYAIRFGGPAVERIEVIDLDPGNRHATLIADLARPDALPSQAFDCLIVTQCLQYMADPGAALRGLGAALRPGGVLLVAVPALAAHDAREADDTDFWRFWPAGLASLLSRSLPGAATSVVGYGNLLTATAFLQGISAQELSAVELDHLDARYPVVVCARADMPVQYRARQAVLGGGS